MRQRSSLGISKVGLRSGCLSRRCRRDRVPRGVPADDRPAWLLRWSLQWRQLWPLLDADADRADLELRLIKLFPRDRARVDPFAGKGGSWCKAGIRPNNDFS